jgi:hypothetical protein
MCAWRQDLSEMRTVCTVPGDWRLQRPMPPPASPGLLLEARDDARKIGGLVPDLGHVRSHKLSQC